MPTMNKTKVKSDDSAIALKLFGTDLIEDIKEQRNKNLTLVEVESGNSVERAASIAPKNITVTVDELKKLCAKVNYVYQTGDENRVFKFIYTNGTVDRYGDVVVAKGGDFKNYQRNPVVLPFHNSHTFPIGKTLKLEYDKETDGIVGTLLIFGNSVDPTGTSEVFYKMLLNGGIQACSIGFRPLKYRFPEKDERDKLGMSEWGIIFEAWDLLELSICSVPANPDALQNAFKSGALSREDLKKVLKSITTPGAKLSDAWEALEKSLEEIPVRKALETWFDTEEDYVKELRTTDDYADDALTERELQATPAVSVLEGKAIGEDTISIQSYIFPKSAWTFEDAKGFFVKAPENKDILSLLSKINDKISTPENPPAVEKIGAVLSKKNKSLVEAAVKELTEAGAAITACATALNDLLSSADSKVEESTQTEVPPGSSTSGSKSLWEISEQEIESIFKNKE